MSDFLHIFTGNPRATVAIILIVLLALVLFRLVNEDNPLKFWHFIASRNNRGEHYADVNKLWQNVGGVAGTFVLVVDVVHDGSVDMGILLVYFGYVGGVAVYAARLRALERRDNPRPSGP